MKLVTTLTEEDCEANLGQCEFDHWKGRSSSPANLF